MTKIRELLRRHWQFFAIVPPLILVMTWPTIARVFDGAEFWLAGDDKDSYKKIWDAWYGKRILAGSADFYYTDLLFHPEGVSLAYHNLCIPHMLLLGLLQEIMPLSNAYNLAYLVIAVLNAYAAYIYINYLFSDRWIALFGAVVFGTSPFALAHPSKPDITVIATLPLSLYFFHRAVCEKSWRYSLHRWISQLGATAFIGMYTLVCLLIILLFYAVAFAASRWKDGRFWLRSSLTFGLVAVFLTLRFVPMLTDSEGLADALTKNAGGNLDSDLLAYFISDGHPITEPILNGLFGLNPPNIARRQRAYLGYLALFLALLALFRRNERRRAMAWTLLLLTFLTLRLGTFLKINDIDYENIFAAQVLP